MTSSTERLDDRYGRPASKARQRWWWIGGGAIAVIAVGAWFLWANPVNFGPQAVAKDTGFSMSSDHVTVTFDLTVTPGRASACAVEALDKGFAVVGWKVVGYPASTEIMRREEVTFRVVSPATTGLVSSCWLT